MSDSANRVRSRAARVFAAIVVTILAVGVLATPSAALAPEPTATTTVLEAFGGGRRTKDGIRGAAISLQLYNGGASGPTTPVDQPWATCTADRSGACYFVVPNTQAGGANDGRRFWVKQVAAPPGFSIVDRLTISDDASNAGAVVPYQFRTPPARAGQALRAGFEWMNVSDAPHVYAQSGGIWPSIADNPPRPEACGLDLALILDVSSHTDVVLMREAVADYVRTLEGTASRVAVITTSDWSPGPLNVNRPLTSVATREGRETVTGWISTVRAGGTRTNWDAGLFRASQYPEAFDEAILFTEHLPNAFSDQAPDPDSTPEVRFIDLERAILSANALKAEGTRVTAFQVGPVVDAGNDAYPESLRAITGPTRNDDFFFPEVWDGQEQDRDGVHQLLQQRARSQCFGTLTIVKQVVPVSAPPGSVEGAAPASGWGFTGTSGRPPTLSGVTSGKGAVGTLEFDVSQVVDGALTVVESQQPFFELQPVNGRNATCRGIQENGGPRNPKNLGSTGFTFNALFGIGVTCTVYNRALPRPLVIADAGGPYTVGEGADLDLDGSDTVAPTGATFAWDVDGDGEFDDTGGPVPTVSGVEFALFGLGDGPAGPVALGLEVRSGAEVSTDITTLVIENVAPTATVLSVPFSPTAGEPADLRFGATDPSTADVTAGFSYVIDWGDGTAPQTVAGETDVAVSHTWLSGGTFTVSVTATDKDGGTSAPATASVVVRPA